jgi:hypothetical protein
VSLVVGPLHAAIRQAAIMTDDESKKVIFSFDKKKLTLQAQGQKTGYMEDVSAGTDPTWDTTDAHDAGGQHRRCPRRWRPTSTLQGTGCR